MSETTDDVSPTLRGERLRRRVIGMLVIILIALLQGTSQYLATHDRARLMMHLVLVACVIPPQMTGLSLGFRYAARHRWRLVPTLSAGVLFSAAFGMLGTTLVWRLAHVVPAFHPRDPWPISRVLVYGSVWGEIALCLWAFAFVFPLALEQARLRSLEAEKLRTAAELARLRAHLEPHFLLNTLNAIAGLVVEEPRAARKLLAALGDLLRDALHDDTEMQTIEEQVAWLRRYAEILEARHAGHLAFRWDIDDRARSELLPRLLLQPLVENAVKHGALKREGGGEVVVRASSDGAKIICAVEDNGPGMSESEIRKGAFGLHAVRRRLELRYASAASLRLESSSAGTRSVVELPLAYRLVTANE
jgi:signal transduction histidine kinase